MAWSHMEIIEANARQTLTIGRVADETHLLDVQLDISYTATLPSGYVVKLPAGTVLRPIVSDALCQEPLTAAQQDKYIRAKVNF